MAADAVLSMVEKELRANPTISSSDLYKLVVKRHPEARQLSIRQFHARYPLRIKKRWSLEAAVRQSPEAGTKRRKTRSRNTGQSASRTREALVRFANELLQMRDPSFTTVLERVNHYADMLMSQIEQT